MTIPENTRAPGKTTIAPEVLLDITRLTAEKIPGVRRLTAAPGVERLFRGGQGSGVRVSTDDETVDLEIYVVLAPDTNFRQVSRELQNQVARAIHEMVGLQVGHINVHIEDIEYAAEEA